MNIGQTVTISFHESYRSVKKGDLFRVVKIDNEKITLAAIDDACLRDDEQGARKRATGKKPGRKPGSRYGVRGGAPRKQNVLDCLATIDKEEEE